MDLAGIGIAGTWAMILISHLAFLRKVKRGEAQRPEFRMPGAPYTNYLALLFFAVVVGSNVTSESGRWTLALFAVVVVLMVAGWYYVRGRVGNLTDEAPPRSRVTRPWCRATDRKDSPCVFTSRMPVEPSAWSIPPEGLRPGADLQGWFGSQLEGIELASNITMSTLDPLIDSSEATPEDWQAIIDDINAHADEADAFLVLHGTDTMAYSAAALSYALASMGKRSS